MIRTQVQLTQDQLRRLRKLAVEEGVSVAEMVRRSVDRALGEGTPSRRQLYERAAQLIGTFADREQATDLSSGHDRYLEDAYR